MVDFPCSIPKSLKSMKTLVFLGVILGTFGVISFWAVKTTARSEKTLNPTFFTVKGIVPLTRNWQELENRYLTVTEITDVSPEQLQITNANISYSGYMDKTSLKDCDILSGHQEAFKILKFWINFTATHNIPWWLSDGSMLGSFRHKDMIPWDTDIDLEIPSQYEGLIRNLSTPRHKISASQVNIVTRPGEFCMIQAPRLDCRGNEVTAQVDSCSFCGPLARFFISNKVRADVFLSDIKVFEKELKVIQYTNFKNYYDLPLMPYQWYFPVTTCSFMGLVLRCPRNSELILKTKYGNLSNLYQCVNKEWKEVKT